MFGLIKWILIAVVVALAAYAALPIGLCMQDGGEWRFVDRTCDTEIVLDGGDVASSYKDLIRIDTPEPGGRVGSPLAIKGAARGQWYFEATFPITIVNWDGLIIGEGYATATDEWMTTEYVPFTATVDFTFDPATPYDRGWIIFHKSNASGLPEHDDAFEMPITFE